MKMFFILSEILLLMGIVFQLDAQKVIPQGEKTAIARAQELVAKANSVKRQLASAQSAVVNANKKVLEQKKRVADTKFLAKEVIKKEQQAQASTIQAAKSAAADAAKAAEALKAVHADLKAQVSVIQPANAANFASVAKDLKNVLDQGVAAVSQLQETLKQSEQPQAAE